MPDVSFRPGCVERSEEAPLVAWPVADRSEKQSSCVRLYRSHGPVGHALLLQSAAAPSISSGQPMQRKEAAVFNAAHAKNPAEAGLMCL